MMMKPGSNRGSILRKTLDKMTQNERWMAKYNEVLDIIQTNHRNPSRYNPEERYKYCNWLKHTKKQFNAGELKQERVELFEKLLVLMEENIHLNQYK